VSVEVVVLTSPVGLDVGPDVGVGGGVGMQGLMMVGTHGVGVGVGLGVGLGVGVGGDVGAGAAVTAGTLSARMVAGLRKSATSPARRTVAATAPRRAALIGRTAAAAGF
jgi:hypothetical protein